MLVAKSNHHKMGGIILSDYTVLVQVLGVITTMDSPAVSQLRGTHKLLLSDNNRFVEVV